MTAATERHTAKRELIDTPHGTLETFRVDTRAAGPPLVAAHPATAYSAETAALLAELAQASVIAINPRGLGASSPADRATFEQMADDLEAVRRSLRLGRWIFWGMSGGGWLGQVYARRHPNAVAAIIVESACLCFRERLSDPACALSPWFPAWRDPLREAGLLPERASALRTLPPDVEWTNVEGVGEALRCPEGPAVLVSPMPIDSDMKRAMPLLWAFDSRAWAHAVTTPALVMAGSDDPVVPVHRVRAVADGLPNSEFALIEGGGHVPCSERRPKAVAALRAFVGRVG